MKFAKGSFTLTPTPAEKPISGKKRTIWAMIKTAVRQAGQEVSGWIGL